MLLNTLRGLLFLSVFFFNSNGLCQNNQNSLQMQTLSAFGHDKKAYTQGLVFHNGFLYESTGQYGQSTLRKVEIETGNVLQQVRLPQECFGEGLALHGKYLYQLTWENCLCFVYDLETFEHVKTLRYKGEGWGLASDGKMLVLSDGSEMLRFYAPADFSLKKTLRVFDDKNTPIRNLNELEFINGEIWANVWKSPKIARIDPNSGKLIGWIDMMPFVPKQFEAQHRNREIADSVLNGIAFDAATSMLFITGKNWPIMYKIHVK